MAQQNLQSRIGKVPVTIPKGVTVSVTGDTVSVKGPKGTLTQTFRTEAVTVKVEDDKVVVQPLGVSARAFQGLYRSLIGNMVQGVSAGFERKLTIEGVGYRAALQGKDVKFQLGYSHDVVFNTPVGIEVEVDKTGRALVIRGADKQVVGQTAAKMRALRPVEPYKGKGVRYEGERVTLKQGKSGKK